MGSKKDKISFRISEEKKTEWKKICVEKKISLSNLIYQSVEGNLFNDERKKIIAFIEKQDNLFVKVETNINQFAKIANAQKFISQNELDAFNLKLTEMLQYKNQQNEIFKKIFELLGK